MSDSSPAKRKAADTATDDHASSEAAPAPATKVSRADDGDDQGDVFSSAAGALFDDSAARDDLRQRYTSGVPFPFLSLGNVFDGSFLERLRSDLVSFDFNLISKSTHDYFETSSLAESEAEAGSPRVKSLRDALYSEKFVRFVAQTTGLDLTPDVHDLKATIFREGGCYTCHTDDNPEESRRAVHFTLYLVHEPWEQSFGGLLDFFSTETDANDAAANRPGSVATSIVPAFNTFVMFPVSDRLFHQITEVKGQFPLLAINGWYHLRSGSVAPPLPPLTRHVEPQLTEQQAIVPLSQFVDVARSLPQSFDLKDWINPKYLQVRRRRRIFCEHVLCCPFLVLRVS